MSAERAVQAIISSINKRIAGVAPFRATVSSLSAGKVLIIRQGAATADTQAYARLTGFDLAVNDEVLCVNLSGQAIVLGKIQRATPTSFAVPVFDSIAIEHGSQDTADVASTASTSVYSTAITRSITLPAGTWTVRATGGIAMVNSASVKATFRVKVDGTTGTAMVTENLSATLYSMWIDIGSKSSISGGGSIDVIVEYHASGSGTVSASNCFVDITATRTA